MFAVSPSSAPESDSAPAQDSSPRDDALDAAMARVEAALTGDVLDAPVRLEFSTQALPGRLVAVSYDVEALAHCDGRFGHYASTTECALQLCQFVGDLCRHAEELVRDYHFRLSHAHQECGGQLHTIVNGVVGKLLEGLATIYNEEARSVSIEKSENGLRLCLEQMRSDISAIWSMCDA